MRRFFTTTLFLLSIEVFAGGGAEVPRVTSQDSPSDESGPPPTGAIAVPSAGDGELIEGGISPVRGFSTDFSRSIVPDSEILSGGPPKDGIPAIDDPSFVPVDAVDWIGESEPILVVSADGEVLDFYPVMMLPWDVASSRYADADVLSRDTGHSRSYGTNPWAGYDSSTRPFLYQGPSVGSQYNPMARVIQVVVDAESFAVAYPFSPTNA